MLPYSAPCKRAKLREDIEHLSTKMFYLKNTKVSANCTETMDMWSLLGSCYRGTGNDKQKKTSDNGTEELWLWIFYFFLFFSTQLETNSGGGLSVAQQACHEDWRQRLT